MDDGPPLPGPAGSPGGPHDSVMVLSGWAGGPDGGDGPHPFIRATLSTGHPTGAPRVLTMSTREEAHAALDEWLDGFLGSVI